MDLAIGVVCHLDRYSLGTALAERVRAHVVSVDQGQPSVAGCAANHRRVLGELAAFDPEWAVVLEDDAAPIDGFAAQARRALRFAPSPIVSMFLRLGDPGSTNYDVIRDALNRANAWIVGDCLLSSVCYAVHESLIDLVISDTVTKRGEWPLRVSRVAQDAGALISYTVPCLVDHSDVRSLLGVGHPVRVAHRVGLPASWACRPVGMGRCSDGWSR